MATINPQQFTFTLAGAQTSLIFLIPFRELKRLGFACNMESWKKHGPRPRDSQKANERTHTTSV